MTGFLLFISKEERTEDEAWNNLLRFYTDLDIPETFYADLDDPDIMKAFSIAREDFNEKWNVDNIDRLREKLQDAKYENKDENYIGYLQDEIERLEAFKNGDFSALEDEELALKNGDLAEWIESKTGYSTRDGKICIVKTYKVRDGKIYTTKNYKNGFFDGALGSLLFHDKQGNEVDSCICKDTDFSELSKNLNAIIWEDSDEYLEYYSYEHGEDAFKKELNEVINNIPPDYYVRGLRYHVSII